MIDVTLVTCHAPSVANPADHEVRVVGWERRKDRVSADLVLAFFDERRLSEVPDAVRRATRQHLQSSSGSHCPGRLGPVLLN
jgi:hypothetical protein